MYIGWVECRKVGKYEDRVDHVETDRQTDRQTEGQTVCSCVRVRAYVRACVRVFKEDKDGRWRFRQWM